MDHADEHNVYFVWRIVVLLEEKEYVEEEDVEERMVVKNWKSKLFRNDFFGNTVFFCSDLINDKDTKIANRIFSSEESYLQTHFGTTCVRNIARISKNRKTKKGFFLKMNNRDSVNNDPEIKRRKAECESLLLTEGFSAAFKYGTVIAVATFAFARLTSVGRRTPWQPLAIIVTSGFVAPFWVRGEKSVLECQRAMWEERKLQIAKQHELTESKY